MINVNENPAGIGRQKGMYYLENYLHLTGSRYAPPTVHWKRGCTMLTLVAHRGFSGGILRDYLDLLPSDQRESGSRKFVWRLFNWHFSIDIQKRINYICL